MAETLPTGEQIRFRSANTGDHVLDTYLESAEIGGRSLTDLLDDLFDPANNGTFRSNNFEFRFDPSTDKLQFRVGQFANNTSGWSDLTTFFSIEGTFSTSTTYNNFDVVTLANKDVYIVHGLSSGTTFSSESNFISSSNTEKLVDVSNAQDWASKVNGIVDSTDYSSKAYAIGGTGVDTGSGSAKDWAIKTGGTVGNTSENSAKHHATAAASSASTATTQANLATTNGAAQVTLATAQVALATTQANNSATSAASSATSATNSANSASAASTSETNAAASAATATTQAGLATSNGAAQVALATTQASNAASSASAAAASQNSAAVSAAAAASAFDNFDDDYLGSKASDPSTDNDGDALATGALYFNSTANEMRVYDGGNWIAASSAGTASLLIYKYTATSNQTTFSGSDDASNTLSYSVDNLIITLNGVVLEVGTDVTASNGTSVVLASGAAANDELNIYAFKSFTTADMVSKSNGGAFQGNVDFGAGIDVTGNITVTGTVDGRDIATDGTKLDGIEASADVTDATNVANAGALMTSGGTLTGDINFGDNEKAVFGAGSDLQIYHANNNSFIEDVGTGNFLITTNGNNIQLMKNQAEQMLVAKTDGSVELYYDNAKKFETSSSGVSVTGGFTATDGCTITTADNSQQLSLISTDADANVGPELHLRRNSASPANNDAAGEISFNANNDAGQNTNIVSVDTKILNVADGTEEGGLELRTMKAGSMRSRINMYGSTTVINDDSQDIDFRVESDGDANAFFVEGSSGNVGIGTASPNEKLTIDSGALSFLGSLSTPSIGAGIFRPANNTLAFVTGSSERMRLDSNGVLLVGKTADSISNNGISLAGSATGGGHLSVTNNGNSCVTLNRKSSDGEIINFRKDGSTVASIGVNSGDNLYVSTVNTGFKIADDENAIIPANGDGSNSDNDIDLGLSGVRFKDGYFSNYLYTTYVAGQSDTNTLIEFPGSNVMKFVTNGGEKARIDSSGNFMVGKTSGNIATAGIELRANNDVLITKDGNTSLYLNRLSSNGTTIEFHRSSSNIGNVSVSTVGVTYNTTSDIRLKQDIEPLQATDKLMQMNPVSYSWKADPDGPRSMGFIAQEMQEVMPEAVSTGDDDDAMMSMDYGRITPILVSALQDAHKKIEELENRIAAMETANE